MTLQLIKQLGITMDNPLAYQTQLPRFDLSGYEDQQTQISRLKMCIYPHSLHHLCQV